MKTQLRYLPLWALSLVLVAQARTAAGATEGAGSETQDSAEIQARPSSTGPPVPPCSLHACSPDGTFYVSASQAGILRYATSDDGAVGRTFYHCSPKSLVFSADGRLFVCAGAAKDGPGEIKIWNLEDGTLLFAIVTELPQTPSLAISPDARWLVCTTGKARVSLWKIGEPRQSWSASLNRAVREVSFSDDGDYISVRCADRTVRRLSLAEGVIVRHD